MALCAALMASGSRFPGVCQQSGAALTGMVLLFFGAILLGMPVSIGMLFATLSYLDLTDAAPLVAVPQAMVDGTGNFILLALPFFHLRRSDYGTRWHQPASGANLRWRSSATSAVACCRWWW